MYDQQNFVLNNKIKKIKLNDLLYGGLSSSESDDSDECFSSFDKFLRINTISNQMHGPFNHNNSFFKNNQIN